MIELLKGQYNLLGVIYIAIVIGAAHVMANKQYNWRKNTLSDLGAQGYSKSWIMRLGFVGFGLIMIGGLFLKIMDNEILYFIDIPVMLYALAILFTGIFSTGPFTGKIKYSEKQDLLHTVFAVAAGVAISIALLMSALLEPDTKTRTLHIVFLVLITLTSTFFGYVKQHNGIMQRVLYAISFCWLILFYNI